MTMIRFNYTDSYANPSRGSLAFMPHRRHAANETEILPKPFTVPLLNGEVTVDLQPNASTWVWIVTEYFEEHAESFYTTVPDKDGVLDHTELTKINPSSIPAPYNAVEPAWWAEIKATKDAVTETLLKSGEALEEAQEAIEVGRESIDTTRENASLAKAYSEQSREHSYDAKDYRDQSEEAAVEAERQADRAASGPESAAGRAESARDDAERYRDESRGYKDDAQSSASEARSAETNAASSSSQASQRADDSESSYRKSRDEADRSENEADRAKGYADDLLKEPQTFVDEAEAARDEARDYRDTTEQYLGEAQGFRDDAEQYRNQSQGNAERAEAAADNIDIGEWVEPELLNNYTSTTIKYRETPLGIQVTGSIDSRQATSTIMFKMPEIEHEIRESSNLGDDGLVRVIYRQNGEVRLANYENYESAFLELNHLIPKD